MGMTEGAWITMAITSAGTFGTIITAIIKSNGGKKNGTPNNSPDPKVCPAHSGLVAEISSLHTGIERLEEGQQKVWDGIEGIRADIKQLIIGDK